MSAAAAVPWRSRIVGSDEEAPDRLLANPANWRLHPKAQQQALAGILGQVGWVQQVLVNRRTGHVVDGHLRVALALSRGETTIPVTYVELSPEEEALASASGVPVRTAMRPSPWPSSRVWRWAFETRVDSRQPHRPSAPRSLGHRIRTFPADPGRHPGHHRRLTPRCEAEARC